MAEFPFPNQHEPTEASEVFVPLSQVVPDDQSSVEAGINGQEAEKDIVKNVENNFELPPPESLDSVRSACGAVITADDGLRTKIRAAIATVPALIDVLEQCTELVETTETQVARQGRTPSTEQIELDAQTTPVRHTAEADALRRENERLQGVVRKLQARLDGTPTTKTPQKGTQRSRAKSKQKKGKGKNTTPNFDESGRSLDPSRVAALAIALTEGSDPVIIAGQLLDEVDRCAQTGQVGVDAAEELNDWTVRQDFFGDLDDAEDEGAAAGPSGLSVQVKSLLGRVDQLDGVVDVTLARVAAVEEDVRDLWRKERTIRL